MPSIRPPSLPESAFPPSARHRASFTSGVHSGRRPHVQTRGTFGQSATRLARTPTLTFAVVRGLGQSAHSPPSLPPRGIALHPPAVSVPEDARTSRLVGLLVSQPLVSLALRH